MAVFEYVFIPCDGAAPLRTIRFDACATDIDGDCREDNGRGDGGDLLPRHLRRLASSSSSSPPPSPSRSSDENNHHRPVGSGSVGGLAVEVEVTPLLRLGGGLDRTTSLYAYTFARFRDDSSAENESSSSSSSSPNVRATSLAMACGLYSRRFVGDTFVGRLGRDEEGKLRNVNLTSEDVLAACVSPDLRQSIRAAVLASDDATHTAAIAAETSVAAWLADACRSNYHDGASLAALASVMTRGGGFDDGDDDRSSADDSCDASTANSSTSLKSDNDEAVASNKEAPAETCRTAVIDANSNDVDDGEGALTRTTLCLHCRGPATSLCSGCGGAYFCDQPRRCRASGWSHQCLCPTWKVYTERRRDLSTFPFPWHTPLVRRECQKSDEPYRRFLAEKLRVLGRDTFWSTEVDGWAGGLSGSAKGVHASVRRSYQEGFGLDDPTLIPPERGVAQEDVDRCGGMSTNEFGLTKLDSWEDYYCLRGVPLSSPVALLCTSPLTVYHAIERHGAVPVTVSRMLRRPMRVHVVGVEKEMNFLDLFKEVGYLLPDDLKIELTFVVRKDMLPPRCLNQQSGDGWYSMRLDLTANLTLFVTSGTYGGRYLDPNFDLNGKPDMIIGMNAGLFAYESWRSVITYLDTNRVVVGVFTDYNEHSGVNCASLGGASARESLRVNPFRQPLAMPVYCMNLPQFSNGFMYVYNTQELDM